MSAPHRGGLKAILLVAGVLIACGAGGFLFYRLTLLRQPTLHPLPVQPRAALPAAPVAPPAAPPVPEQLPGITLPGLDGTPHSLHDWKGKPLIINFWATWCEPCRREIPLLEALRRERFAQGVEVIGIAVDSLEAVRKYIPTVAIRYPVLIGEQGGLAAVSAFGMDTVLPFSVFADRSGRVVALKVGELRRDEAELILDRVGDVDAGRLSVAAAREQIAAGIGRLSAARSGLPPLAH